MVKTYIAETKRDGFEFQYKVKAETKEEAEAHIFRICKEHLKVKEL